MLGLFKIVQEPHSPASLGNETHVSLRQLRSRVIQAGNSLLLIQKVLMGQPDKSKGTRAQRGRRLLITCSVVPRLPTANAAVSSSYPGTSLDTCLIRRSRGLRTHLSVALALGDLLRFPLDSSLL